MRGRDLRRKLVGCKLLFLNDLAGRQGFSDLIPERANECAPFWRNARDCDRLAFFAFVRTFAAVCVGLRILRVRCHST
jgi:hypothetical protein